MPSDDPFQRPPPTSMNLTPAQLAQLQRDGDNPRPSSSFFPPDETPPRPSTASDSNYPSWLPRRPSKPVPRASHEGQPEMRSSYETSSSSRPGASGSAAGGGSGRWARKYGRKPTPRAVRILAVQPDHSDPVGLAQRSRSVAFGATTPIEQASTAEASPITGVFHPSARDTPRVSGARPRFNVPGLHLELANHPSPLNRVLFYIFPILVFAHIPIQAFLDFNAVAMLLQVAKHPTASAPGAPASGRGWAFAFAAYLASYLIYFFCVFIGYELVYSFYRRWRANRPLILPIYLSAPAANLVAMRSYAHFCFLQYIRVSAFMPSQSATGSLTQGLAETCFLLSQNLPTVILLLPRGALCLALLLTFSSSSAAARAAAHAGGTGRDSTWFDNDGSLSAYARGVLIANCVWIAWRIVVLLASWVGLWILSGQGCAGLCGPRYRWEEEEDSDEKAALEGEPYYRRRNESVVEKWPWVAQTAERIQEVYDLCLISAVPPSKRYPRASGEKTVQELEEERRNNRHSRNPSLPHQLPPMDQLSTDLDLQRMRTASDPQSQSHSGSHSQSPQSNSHSQSQSQSQSPSTPPPMPAYPFSAEHMVHARRARERGHDRVASGSGSGDSNDPYANMPGSPDALSPLLGHVPQPQTPAPLPSQSFATQQAHQMHQLSPIQGSPRTPARKKDVLGGLGASTSTRRTILDDAVFAGLGSAAASVAGAGVGAAGLNASASGSKAPSEKTSKRGSVSVWDGASLNHEASKGKGKAREQQCPTTGAGAAQTSSFVPPYPFGAEAAPVVPLPFPLLSAEQRVQEPLDGDLTPPQGSEGRSALEEEEEEEEHSGEHEPGEEDDDDLAGLDLDGFVVGDEDDDEDHHQAAALRQRQNLAPSPSSAHPSRHARVSDESRKPRVSDESALAGSGSISSLGQPISSSFPFALSHGLGLTEDPAARRSLSLDEASGSLGRRSLSLGSASVSSPHSSGRGRGGPGTYTSSPRAGPYTYSPQYPDDEDDVEPEVRSLRWSFSNSASSHSHSHPRSRRTGGSGPPSVRSRVASGLGSSRSRTGSLLEAPPRHPSAGTSLTRRRGRADTIPSPLASSQGSGASAVTGISRGSGGSGSRLSSEFGERFIPTNIAAIINSRRGANANGAATSTTEERTRTISMQDQTFGPHNPLPPVHGTEDDDEDDYMYEDEFIDLREDLRAVVEEGESAAGESRGPSLDEGEREREDSVGLLSHGPSPQSSMGMLRSRASSLVGSVNAVARRRGSQGSQSAHPHSHSPGGSAAYVSAQQSAANSQLNRSRSRSGSLAQSGGSRKSSVVSLATAAPAPASPVPVISYPFPGAGSTTSLTRGRPTRGDSSPSSLAMSLRSTASGPHADEEHTFGLARPVNWDEVPRLSSAGPSRHVSLISGPPPPLPMPSPDARRSLRPSASRGSSRSGGGASDHTNTQPPMPAGAAGSVVGGTGISPTEFGTTEYSEAPSSYVTAAPTIESTSEGAGTIRSYQPLDDLNREVM